MDRAAVSVADKASNVSISLITLLAACATSAALTARLFDREAEREDSYSCEYM